MTGIQFATDEKGRKTAVLIDLKKHKAIWEDFWDGLVSESHRKEKGIPYEEYRAKRLNDNGQLNRAAGTREAFGWAMPSSGTRRRQRPTPESTV